MRRFSAVLPFVFLALLPLALAEINPKLNCVSVTVSPLDASNPNAAINVNLTFHNGCGKDITAVGFHLHPSAGTDWSIGWDFANLLGQPEERRQNNDILHADATMSQEVARNSAQQGKIRASAAYVVFMDCTSVGDAQLITQVVRYRRDQIAIYEQQEEMLAEVVDRDQARTFLSENHDDLKGINKMLLKELRTRVEQLTPSQWTEFIQERQAHAKRLVSTFETHSVVTLPAS